MIGCNRIMDEKRFRNIGKLQIGKLYKFGSKWCLNETDPKGPVDCSGFSKWMLSQFGIDIPEGSDAQFAHCVLLNPQSQARTGDLAFFRMPDGDITHVGLVFDEKDMIEARGAPFNAVILRPRAKWEAFSRFSGYYRAPNES